MDLSLPFLMLFGLITARQNGSLLHSTLTINRLDGLHDLRRPLSTSLPTQEFSYVRRNKRGAVHAQHSYYWHRAIIPYHMTSAFYSGEESATLRERIESAMWEIEFHSCIRFIELSQYSAHMMKTRGREPRDFVVLIDDPNFCYSAIGRVGGAQIAALGRGCSSRGNVLHELLHAVGMWHTTTRMDRDRHVSIVWDNIDLNHYRNFLREFRTKVTWLGEPYDTDSIMHYGTHQFSFNGLPTIIPRDKNAVIGQRHALSQGDKRLLHKMYRCRDGECGIRGACGSGRCVRSSVTGKRSCVCRANWYGSRCTVRCPQCYGATCENALCLEGCRDVNVTECAVVHRPRVESVSLRCTVPTVRCGLWRTFNSTTEDWTLDYHFQEGVSLKTADSLERMTDFTVMLRTLDILQSVTFYRSLASCELYLSYLTSGLWYFYSLEVLIVTGDKAAIVWHSSLRMIRGVDLSHTTPILHPREAKIPIGVVVNFSVLVRVHLYESRGDIVIRNLEFNNCW